MTAAQSKKLKKGDSVIWKHDPKDTGTVLEANGRAVQIRWHQDQSIGIIDHRDMEDVQHG